MVGARVGPAIVSSQWEALMRTRWLGTMGTMAACIVAGVGCSHPQVQSELPIRRVVVYRNGVAYFERAGRVEKEDVRFKMRQSEVGDFLATLAVMEQGGSSVRSAAFPLKDETGKPPKDDKAKEDLDNALRTVVLALDGRAHDLQVGYVAAAPVWRPSYRLVVEPNGEAELQAWGIVENLSGEDWSGVQLSLVAGAPLAFEAQLGTPVIPGRPVVTDSGEVIAAMPRGETSLADRDGDGIPDSRDVEVKKPGGTQPAEPAAAAPAAMAPIAEADFSNKEDATGKAGQKGPAVDAIEQDRRHGNVDVVPSQPRNVHSLAAIAVQGGSTRYDIPNAITVPDKNATMVLLLARRVPGEAIFLFAPDDGVPDSATHPFHVARFENATAGVLERGPIAVFEKGSFLGQGLLDPLPAAAAATVPFALERAIGIDQERKTDVQGTRLAKIDNGSLWIEHDFVLKTTYRVQNGGNEPAKMLVKHARASGARLHEPPAGTEDNVGTGSALVPTTLPPYGKQELVVDERAAQREYADWFGAAADTAVTAYVADKRADRAVAQQLAAAWPLRAQIVAKQDQRSKLQQELNQLRREATEKRADLQAIEKNKAAEALRKTLTARLAALSARTDTVTAQNIQLGQELSELQVRWRESIRAIHLDEGQKPAPGQ
jgi:hypothetical protein